MFKKFINTKSLFIILFLLINISLVNAEVSKTKVNTVDIKTTDVKTVADANQIEDFSIKSIEILNFKQIYVNFNSNLYDWEDAIRNFTLKNKNDFLDELYISGAVLDKLDSKKLLLTFNTEAKANWTYELVVVSLLDENWRNIENWINSFYTVVMPDKIVDNSTTINKNNSLIDENIELNSSANNKEITNINSKSNSWTNVEKDFITNNVVSESKNLEVLPKTWPANFFIFILASILAALIFIFRFRKTWN